MSETQPFKYAVIERPFPNERENGDQYLIKNSRNSTLIAVADGLGHGISAAEASKSAMRLLKNTQESSLPKLLNYCHQKLKGSRGVVLALVKIEGYRVTWTGVGNILGIHWPGLFETKSHILLSHGGVVGQRMPKITVESFMAGPRHTLILASDGLNNALLDELPQATSPKALAKKLFNKYATIKDDALILVLNWVAMYDD